MTHPIKRFLKTFNLMQYVDPNAEEFDGGANAEEEVYFDNGADKAVFQTPIPAIPVKRNPVYPQPIYNPTPMFQQSVQPASFVRRVVVPRHAQPQPLPSTVESNFNKAKQVYRINRATGEAVPMRSWPNMARTTAVQQQRDTRLTETQNTLYNNQQIAPYSPYAQSTSSSVYSEDYTNEVSELVPKKSFTAAYVPPPKPHGKKKLPVGAKKPCNCTKSMCLKLYCDCFANGEFCKDCNCKDCHNNLDHEAERSRAIKSSLERNPNAFKPKIGVTAKGKADVERLHQKGCHCKKSNCLKNYCECFEAKVPCTDRCKCTCCRNTETDRANRQQDQAKQTAQQSQTSSAQQTPVAKGLLNGFSLSDEETESSDLQVNPKSYPWFYLTDEVVEATALCLIARLEEAEGRTEPEVLEGFVLKEFARCLEQIIDNANQHSKGGDLSTRFPIPPLPTKPLSVNDEEEDERVDVD